MAEKPFPTPVNLTQQMQNLCWRLATEMRALYNTIATKLSKSDADSYYLGKTDQAESAKTADTAGSAATLTTARTIRTNLASSTAVSFDGSGNVTPGVTGTLPIANGGTGGNTASAARTALGIKTLTNDGAISSGAVDYNTLTAPGFYHCNATGSTNGPGFAAKVMVIRDGTAGNYIAQVAYPIDSARAPVWRTSQDGGTTWADWTEFAEGYLPLTGGTVTGTLKAPMPAASSNDTTVATTAWTTTHFAKASALSGYLPVNGKAAAATSADSAIKASQDSAGNVITETYLTKAEYAGRKIVAFVSDSRDSDLPMGEAFTVPAYQVGMGNLLVWLDGILCAEGDQYTEETSTSIAFTFDLPADSQIIAKVIS